MYKSSSNVYVTMQILKTNRRGKRATMDLPRNRLMAADGMIDCILREAVRQAGVFSHKQHVWHPGRGDH